MKKGIESLSHTRRKYKYHIVFAPKYRRIMYGKYKESIGELCEGKNVEIAELERNLLDYFVNEGIEPSKKQDVAVGYPNLLIFVHFK